MKHEWILDVLADLQQFARENGLPVLCEHLGDTSVVATAELASLSSELEVSGHNATRIGDDSRAASQSTNS